MKQTTITLACLLVASLAFAQTSSNHKSQTTAEPITVTETFIKMTSEEAVAASYQPLKTLVVRQDAPGRYVLNGRGRVVNNAGEIVQTAIKPGSRVRVYYVNTGDLRVVDHVVTGD